MTKPLMLQLISQSGEDLQFQSGPVVLGRERTCQVVVRGPAISRKHARIEIRPKAAILEDLNSSNGTFLNGQRISTSQFLSNGDQIKIGGTTFQVKLPQLGPKSKPAFELPSRPIVCGVAILVVAVFAFAVGRLAVRFGSFTISTAYFSAPADDNAGNGGDEGEKSPNSKQKQADDPKAKLSSGVNLNDSLAVIRLMKKAHERGTNMNDAKALRALADELKIPADKADRVVDQARRMAGDRTNLIEDKPPVDPSTDANQKPDNEKTNEETEEPVRSNTWAAVGPGFYFNPLSLGLFAALLAAWLRSGRWVAEDLKRIEIAAFEWIEVIFWAGLAGIAATVILADFAFGFSLLAVSLAAPLLFYVTWREQEAPEDLRMMGPLVERIRAFLPIGQHNDSEGNLPVLRLRPNDASFSQSGQARKAESSRAYQAIVEIMAAAQASRATDIHVVPESGIYNVDFRIDGIMSSHSSLTMSLGKAIVNLFKVYADLDISQRRLPQDGGLHIEFAGEAMDLRVATQGTNEGEKIIVRLLSHKNALQNLSALGLRGALQGQLRETLSQPHGLVLSCGPTGAGKSTTLRASLGEMNATEQNIITIEDPVEYRLPGVNQIQINKKAGQTFATVLRSVLRQDPDVILIGEIRDAETANIACQAANTGHMVLSTIHANDTTAALYRLFDLGVEPYVVSTSLTAILSQRLVRCLCEHCREEYVPGAKMIRQLRLPSNRALTFCRPPTKPTACTHCGGTGYYGRMGVFELFQMNDQIGQHIQAGSTLQDVRKAARKAGMARAVEEGLRLVVQGKTSLAEIQRVLK